VLNTHSPLDRRVDLWAFTACYSVNFTYFGYFSCNSVSSWNSHSFLKSFHTTMRAEQLYSFWTTTVRHGARTVPHSVPGRSLRKAFVTELFRIEQCSRKLPSTSKTLYLNKGNHNNVQRMDIYQNTLLPNSWEVNLPTRYVLEPPSYILKLGVCTTPTDRRSLYSVE